MGLLGTQTIESADASISQWDLSYSALDASTSKITIVIDTRQYDASTTPDLVSVTYDQGGNNESCTHISGARAYETFAGDRHFGSEVWYLDSPTDLSAGTLRIVMQGTATSAEVVVAIYEWDDDADSGGTGATAATSGNSSTMTFTMSTGASDHEAIAGIAAQVSDATPFTPQGVTDTEVYDGTPAGGSSSHWHAYGTTTGGTDTVGANASAARRFGLAAYEVELTISAGDVSVNLSSIALDAAPQALSVSGTGTASIDMASIALTAAPQALSVSGTGTASVDLAVIGLNAAAQALTVTPTGTGGVDLNSIALNAVAQVITAGGTGTAGVDLSSIALTKAINTISVSIGGVEVNLGTMVLNVTPQVLTPSGTGVASVDLSSIQLSSVSNALTVDPFGTAGVDLNSIALTAAAQGLSVEPFGTAEVNLSSISLSALVQALNATTGIVEVALDNIALNVTVNPILLALLIRVFNMQQRDFTFDLDERDTQFDLGQRDFTFDLDTSDWQED